MKSKYLTHEIDWNERIRVMEENLNDGYYDYLYFGISLNMLDARDNADYDREQIMQRMLNAYKKKNENTMRKCLAELKHDF